MILTTHPHLVQRLEKEQSFTSTPHLWLHVMLLDKLDFTFTIVHTYFIMKFQKILVSIWKFLILNFQYAWCTYPTDICFNTRNLKLYKNCLFTVNKHTINFCRMSWIMNLAMSSLHKLKSQQATIRLIYMTTQKTNVCMIITR